MVGIEVSDASGEPQVVPPLMPRMSSPVLRVHRRAGIS